MATAGVLLENKYKAARQPLANDAVRRRSPSQARVAVLSGLMTAAALQIGTAVVLNLWFPQMIDPSFGNRLASVEEGRAADPARTRTVIMVGSSRTYCGLATSLLRASLTGEVGRPVSVVNAGYLGGGSLTELLFWKRLRRKGVRPDLLLIEVMPLFLVDWFTSEEVREERLPTNRVGWLDLPLLNRYQAGMRPALRRDLVLSDVNTLYNRRRGIIQGIAPFLQPDTGANDGDLPAGPRFVPADPTPQTRQMNLTKAHGACGDLKTFSLDGRDRAVGALHELLASCRESGVPTRLVVMPEGPVFRSWYGPDFWPKFQDFLEQIAREEGSQLIVAREWIEEEDDFLDSHHLLPRGAKKFSERLGRKYILPLLRQQVDARR